MKRALITGVTGQDGAYLAQLLLDKGYEVHGLQRRSSVANTERIEHLLNRPRFITHYGDVTDSSNLIRLISEIEPHEIYNLAAQSHVHVSFETPEYTANVDALGALRILEALRILKMTDRVKFLQASTSELYGDTTESPQSELTPFAPCSPYATAKLYAYWITQNYRKAYNIFAVNSICFNHESPLRSPLFVTRKISQAVARIFFGLQQVLYLGNLDAQRDWGYAPDYVRAMWLMLSQNEPDDYVIATGVAHSVRQFVECAFKEIGITILWHGSGLNEKGMNAETGKVLVLVNEQFMRPADIACLRGNASKANSRLLWQPTVTFNELVGCMVAHDIACVKQELQSVSLKNNLWELG